MKEESKVKPFYLRYEDWMTAEKVQEVLEKAVKCGAMALEGLKGSGFKSVVSHDYYSYFGVEAQFNGTFFTDTIDGFGKGAIEITLDKVDEHLGLTKVDKSSDATPQSLVGCKIDLRNEDGSVNSELSAAFQEACFAQGLDWYGDSYVKLIDKPFLYVSKHGITYSDKEYTFLNATHKEVKFEFERKLNWSVKYMTNETTRKIVEIGGVSYYEDKLLEAVQLLEAAKVVDSGVSTMGTGTPPERPVNMQ